MRKPRPLSITSAKEILDEVTIAAKPAASHVASRRPVTRPMFWGAKTLFTPRDHPDLQAEPTRLALPLGGDAGPPWPISHQPLASEPTKQESGYARSSKAVI
jgi:hypothetical protein